MKRGLLVAFLVTVVGVQAAAISGAAAQTGKSVVKASKATAKGAKKAGKATAKASKKVGEAFKPSKSKQ